MYLVFIFMRFCGIIYGNNNRDREMKKFVSWFAICLLAMPAFATEPAGQARRSMSAQMVAPAARAVASTNQINMMANYSGATTNKSSVRVPPQMPGDETVSDSGDTSTDVPDDDTDDDKLAEIERQKQACLGNNIGVGNTFVWASRYSNTSNYSSMVEDVEHPENNICFVLVEIKSNDPRINVSDVPSKYFQMGQNITCGSWGDEGVLRQRILDAKRSGRTWWTVGGAVVGAGAGVGAMELFGNRLIGGAVEGQKARSLSEDERLLMQLRALRNDSPSEFNDYMDALEVLKDECENWTGDNRPDECDDVNYEYLLNARGR